VCVCVYICERRSWVFEIVEREREYIKEKGVKWWGGNQYALVFGDEMVKRERDE
jgi:hypothetical protein